MDNLLNLKELFWRGLIVGPEESVASFVKRLDNLKKEPPVPLFDLMEVDWVSVDYSNKGLRLWEGGCSWINEEGVTIQLRQSFAHRIRLFGIYSKREILAHEMVHSVRFAFEEPVFEEIFAYQTAESRFRRLIGPLFRTPKESLITVCLLALLPLFPLLSIPLALLIFFFSYRLRKAYQALNATLKKLATLTSLPPLLWALALTDHEINLFSTLSSSEIKEYIKTNQTLRWEQLRLVFINTSY